MSIYNLRRKKTLSLLMSFLPKNKLLQIIKTSRRLQKALRIKPVLYEIYSLKQSNIYKEYDLSTINEDDYTKREILSSLFEISSTPFFNGIGYSFQAHNKRISSMTKLSNGNIATISWDNTVKIWDLDNNQPTPKVLSINQEDIICSIIQLDKQRVLVSTWDKDIIIFNMKTNEKEEEYSIEHFGKVMCTIKIDDYFIASSYDPRIKIWKFTERKHIKTLIGHKAPVPMIISLNDGIRIASGSWDTTVKIWSINTGDCEMTLETKNDKIISILLLNDGRLASCSLDSIVKIWNLKTVQSECTFEGNDFLYQLADGRIVTGLLEKEYQIVNPSNAKKEIVVRTDHQEPISGIMQLNDGRLVTCSYDKTLKVYGFVNKKELAKEAFEYDFIFSDHCLYISYKNFH